MQKIHTIVISSWRLIEKKSRVTFFFIKFIVYDPSWRVLQIWTNQTICWQIRQLAVLSSISFIQYWCFSTIESKYKYFKIILNIKNPRSGSINTMLKYVKTQSVMRRAMKNIWNHQNLQKMMNDGVHEDEINKEYSNSWATLLWIVRNTCYMQFRKRSKKIRK